MAGPQGTPRGVAPRFNQAPVCAVRLGCHAGTRDTVTSSPGWAVASDDTQTVEVSRGRGIPAPRSASPAVDEAGGEPWEQNVAFRTACPRSCFHVDGHQVLCEGSAPSRARSVRSAAKSTAAAALLPRAAAQQLRAGRAVTVTGARLPAPPPGPPAPRSLLQPAPACG